MVQESYGVIGVAIAMIAIVGLVIVKARRRVDAERRDFFVTTQRPVRAQCNRTPSPGIVLWECPRCGRLQETPWDGASDDGSPPTCRDRGFPHSATMRPVRALRPLSR